MNQHQYTRDDCLQLLSRHDPLVLDLLTRYAAEEGQWITIGGKQEGEEKHVGGFRVQIDKEGRILKGGPKELRGKPVSQAGGILREKRLGRHDQPGKEEIPEKPLTPSVPSGTNREEKEAGGSGNAPAGGTPDKGGIPMRSIPETALKKIFPGPGITSYQFRAPEATRNDFSVNSLPRLTSEEVAALLAVGAITEKKYRGKPDRFILQEDWAEKNKPAIPVVEQKQWSAPWEIKDATPAKKISEGWWSENKAGQRVARVLASEIGLDLSRHGMVQGASKIREGDVVEVEGKKFQVKGVGSPFRAGDSVLVYLYPESPRKRSFEPGREEIPDDPMERMEQEQRRAEGRTGELPGA